jgi:hypothetical protein
MKQYPRAKRHEQYPRVKRTLFLNLKYPPPFLLHRYVPRVKKEVPHTRMNLCNKSEKSDEADISLCEQHHKATMAAAPNSMYAGPPGGAPGEWSTGILDMCAEPGGCGLCCLSSAPGPCFQACTRLCIHALKCAVSTQSSNTLACG